MNSATVEVSAIPKKPSKKGGIPQVGRDTSSNYNCGKELLIRRVFLCKLHFLCSEDMFQPGDYSRPPPAASAAVPASSAAPPGGSSSWTKEL
jgi:hypothetical protein